MLVRLETPEQLQARLDKNVAQLRRRKPLSALREPQRAWDRADYADRRKRMIAAGVIPERKVTQEEA